MPKKNPTWNYFVKFDSILSKAQCNVCNKLLFLGSDKAKSAWSKTAFIEISY